MQLMFASLPLHVEIQWKLTEERLNEWLQTGAFSFRWWLMLSLFILSAYIWWKTVDKSRLNEIILYTAIIIIIILVLDEIGEELALWDYAADLLPLFPPATAVDFCCLPGFYSLIFQLFKSWKSFIIVSLLMSTVFCFVLEPIFVWIGVYQMLNWKSYYGFPIYALMGIIAKAIVNKLSSISSKA